MYFADCNAHKIRGIDTPEAGDFCEECMNLTPMASGVVFDPMDYAAKILNGPIPANYLPSDQANQQLASDAFIALTQVDWTKLGAGSAKAARFWMSITLMLEQYARQGISYDDPLREIRP